MAKRKPFHRPFSKLDKKRSSSAPSEPDKSAAKVAEELESRAPKRFADFARGEGVSPLKLGPDRVAPMASAAGHGSSPLAAPLTPGGLTDHTFAIVDEDGWLEGRRDDVPQLTMRGLRRRSYRAQLDLHGFTAAEARSAVHRFVVACHDAGDDVVLIIVGKGKQHASGRGVLRDNIAVWLSESPSASCTRAFVSAPRKYGGDGAILVLLRNK